MIMSKHYALDPLGTSGARRAGRLCPGVSGQASSHSSRDASSRGAAAATVMYRFRALACCHVFQLLSCVRVRACERIIKEE